MKVFLSGIAGTGMSSLAGLFKEKGFDISGSDRKFYPPTGDILKKMKIKLFDGFNEKNISEDIDLCIIGNIISRGNPEAEFILNRDIPYISMAEALYRFFIKGKNSVVVSGTHGKTTTASFTAFLFKNAGIDPGYFIGGKPVDLSSGYSTGKGDYFISEGDEYETSFFDRSSKFLKYHPRFLLLTSLEYDHIDFFKTPDNYLYAFRNLVNQVPSDGIIIANSDYPLTLEAVKGSLSKIVTYGESSGDFIIKNILLRDEGFDFTISSESREFNFKTGLRGKYNIWNLTAGIIMGMKAGIDMEIIERSVLEFSGVERRLRELGRIDKTVYFEDFAHHPTSISAVLNSLRETFPNRIIKVFIEPGSWSLKHKMFEERLTESLMKADEISIKSVNISKKFPESSTVDLKRVRDRLVENGKRAEVSEDYEEMKEEIKLMDNSVNRAVILLSNGGFGGLPGFTSSIISKNY